MRRGREKSSLRERGTPPEQTPGDQTNHKRVPQLHGGTAFLKSRRHPSSTGKKEKLPGDTYQEGRQAVQQRQEHADKKTHRLLRGSTSKEKFTLGEEGGGTEKKEDPATSPSLLIKRGF